MQCSSCQRPLAATAVFPGGNVTCAACGTRSEVGAARTHSPYREPAAERESSAAPASRSVAVASPAAASTAKPVLGSCPRCAVVALSARAHEDVCPRCGGLFVLHQRLREIVHEHRASGVRPAVDPDQPSSVSSAAAVMYLRCPRCAAFMNRKNFGKQSGVLLDVCTMHGVWFDRGELDVVAAFAFDLPADAALRKALLALVGSPAVAPRQPPRPAAPAIADLTISRARVDLETVEGLLSWLGRWFW